MEGIVQSSKSLSVFKSSVISKATTLEEEPILSEVAVTEEAAIEGAEVEAAEVEATKPGLEALKARDTEIEFEGSVAAVEEQATGLKKDLIEVEAELASGVASGVADLRRYAASRSSRKVMMERIVVGSIIDSTESTPK